ncbi:MAG: hypothetical protein RQ862_03490 [Candidatus Caldarchaeales archaeon]|nr:hypothetical protein [Candidatus Caldarchaeales archaeon]
MARRLNDKTIGRRLIGIAEQATAILNRWGISKPIIVASRAEALPHIRSHFWGYGSWDKPEKVFVFSSDEIAVYKPYKIRAYWGEFIEFRPFGKVCSCVRTGGLLPISPQTLLALCALATHLVDVYSMVHFFRTYDCDGAKRELMFSGDTKTGLEVEMVIANEENAKITINRGEASVRGTLGTVVGKLLSVLAISSI